MNKLFPKNQHLSSFRIISLGFLGAILVGSLLLMLPFATRDGRGAAFFDALFTATSATCVTGLVVQDTASYWSMFGQAVILILIQIGGMGVITIAVAIALISGKKIGLMQRSTMQEAISAPNVGGIVKLTGFILKVTFLTELLGTFLMLPVFGRDFDIKEGIWYSLFHSISAFCNAGFDLMGKTAPFSSLTGYEGRLLINLVVMLLIIIGGIGFLTWDDVWRNGIHIKRYRMQSKVILVTTLALIVLPAALFFANDYSGLPLGERLLAATFQSVTPRTAGFNTTDLTKLSGASRGVMILLMLIGGSPGSTAGGMKTTTFTVMMANAIATFRQRESVELYGRRIDCGTVRTAATIMMLYLTLFFGGALVISIYEGLPFSSCLFETASAVATVGLTLGLTPHLHILSQLILIGLMYMGRVGGLTLIYATVSNQKTIVAILPQEHITVG